MTTKIKTGLVYQRTTKGPNYLCLGKATINGETKIISVKNGSIRNDGRCKLGHTEQRVSLFAHSPASIARIHQVRNVDVKSVFTRGEALPGMKTLTKRMIRRGVNTNAEIPVVQNLI